PPPASRPLSAGAVLGPGGADGAARLGGAAVPRARAPGLAGHRGAPAGRRAPRGDHPLATGPRPDVPRDHHVRAGGRALHHVLHVLVHRAARINAELDARQAAVAVTAEGEPAGEKPWWEDDPRFTGRFKPT